MFSGRVLATFPLALLTLAACGDSGEEPEEARPSAESSLDQISEDAETAMREAGSFRVTGTDTRDGDRLSVDLRISGEECRGTIGIAGEGSFRLIHVGGVSYFKADEEFWTSQAGDRASARAAMEMIGDRWAFDSTDPNGFGELCDVDGNCVDAGDDEIFTLTTSVRLLLMRWWW